MKFKVGQTVEVVDNHSMCASLGATAIVRKANHDFIGHELIDVVWKTNYNNQMNGAYMTRYFKPKFVHSEQFLFDFMQQS